MFIKKRLLHRDISIGNLAYEYIDGEYHVILLDFDLATIVGEKNHINGVRTGTAHFMARDMLDGLNGTDMGFITI